MSTMKIISLNSMNSSFNSGSWFSNQTAEVTTALREWNDAGWISGDALCCVTSLTPGVGVLAEAPGENPWMWAFSGGVTVGDRVGTAKTDLKSLAELMVRPSEIFPVRGASIVNAWGVYLFNRRQVNACQIAVRLL